MCPLLELMANKAMKPRHWARIMEVCRFTFEFDTAGFSLKNILEAPIRQYKENIEDICISSIKEKDIESKLKVRPFLDGQIVDLIAFYGNFVGRNK